MNISKLYSGVFRWLAIGLLVTFVTGFILASNPSLLATFYTSNAWVVALVIQVGAALLFGFMLHKIDYSLCVILYLLYCVITGITIGFLLTVYYLSSVIMIFGVTSLIFAFLAFLGDKMNVDVSKMGRILLFTLLGTIIVSIINLFIGSSSIELLLCIVSIIVFMGYVIYDLKIIEPLAREYGEDKVAVYGAFQLYIDFINLFIRLLELFGRRRD